MSSVIPLGSGQGRFLSAAALLSAAAVALGGCGAGHPRLASGAEHELLGLVNAARAAAARHDRAGVTSALERFVGLVQALRAAGQLSPATAASLERQAQAAVRSADAQLASANATSSPVEANGASTAAKSPSAQPKSPGRGRGLQPHAGPGGPDRGRSGKPGHGGPQAAGHGPRAARQDGPGDQSENGADGGDQDGPASDGLAQRVQRGEAAMGLSPQ